MSRDLESTAEIILDRNAELVAGLGEAQKSIAAIAADIAACSGADLPACDLTANVVLRAVCVERDFRPIQHHQQLRLVGMKPRQQAIQCGEAGAAEEYTVEPSAQRGGPAPAGLEPVSLEVAVIIPDQTANFLLRGTMLIGEGVQLVYRPVRVNPAQRVPADLELARPRLRRGRLYRSARRRRTGICTPGRCPMKPPRRRP
jgi:hypothetical protein